MTVPDGVAEGLTAAPAAAHRFTALDSLRGIAALGVLLHHLPATNGLAVLPLAGAGSLFVDLFFVLSGFVIAASYGERLADGFSVRRFALLRLGRVVPLHLFMVAAYLALELAAWMFGSGGLNLSAPFSGVHSPGHLLRAIFLLDGYFPIKHNFYNGVSWSISIELLLYGLAVLAFRARRAGLAAFYALGLAALALQLAGVNLPVLTNALERGLAGFAGGLACWQLYQLRPQPLPFVALFEVLALGALFGFVWFVPLFGPPALILVPAMAVVFVFAQQAGPLSGFLMQRGWVWLGAISYSLYMVHVMVLARIADLFLLASRYTAQPLARYTWQDGIPIKAIDLPLLPALLVQGAMIGACLLAAHWTYRLIEEPARQWSRRRAEQL